MASSSLLSSGDLIADRRLEHARGYAAAGEPRAAAELTEQALEIVPGWSAGWFELGGFLEAAEDTAGAIGAYERALALDGEDRCGATLRLARLGARAAPDVPPAAHVRDLFDGYADRFEEALVDRLGYRAPELLAAAIEAAAGDRAFATAVDLGCGTGLMAAEIRDRVGRLEGCDLSPAMVAAAAQKGLYDALAVGDVNGDLEARAAASLDLVTAADVFCYLGDLGAVMAATARVLVPGGVFAFTVESDGAEETVSLAHSLRYKHGRAHVERRARSAGLEVVRLEDATLRLDRGAEVGGFVVVLAKS